MLIANTNPPFCDLMDFYPCGEGCEYKGMDDLEAHAESRR